MVANGSAGSAGSAGVGAEAAASSHSALSEGDREPGAPVSQNRLHFESKEEPALNNARQGRCIPALREDELWEAPSLDPAEYARTTCYQAGHLVTKNAGWRSVRPVVDPEACTKCLQCYLYCPDGTVYKARGFSDVEDAFFIAIDYDFCKGCGICARICKFGAISMIPERGVSLR